MNYILDRIKEKSTWRGFVMLLTAFGISLSPEQADSLVMVGLAAAGVIGAFFKD